MPAGRPRTPSRGRPPKKGGRSQSASRQTKSPSKPVKKSKSPQKATPKPSKSRSTSRSRKIATAPAAVSAKKRAPSGRPESPRSRATTTKTTTVTTFSKGSPQPLTSVTVSTSSGPRGTTSPPMLRSRALGAALAQTAPAPQKPMFSKPQRTWRQAIRSNYFTQQLGKFGRKIRQGPRPMIKSASKHFKANWKYYLLALAFLLLAGLIYKFQRELLTNVQQINKQVVEFVQQQYEQQRRIFGEYLLKTQEALEQARQKYLTSNPTQTSSTPSSPMDTQQSATPPPKPTRSPHLTDTL